MPVLTAPLSDEVLNDSTSASFTCDVGRSWCDDPRKKMLIFLKPIPIKLEKLQTATKISKIFSMLQAKFWVRWAFFNPLASVVIACL